ncbi:NEL-type E3 ubiquitin ligase domain-containing protein [Pseudomonas sp. AMR01]|uniref:NEL-type E3 ubiquitin ligase domain-containing protein n=1 Tax=Pseudomonas sp. AMR01 TaxID=3064904 RepID=UPI0035BEF77E
MPTHQFTNGLSGHLQSSEAWGQQQALELLRQVMAQSMNSLTLAQQRDYVRLQREAHAALKAVEAENTLQRERFKASGLATLSAKLGGLDPEKAFLHTRYLEKLEPPLPWEPRSSSAVGGLGAAKRFRRAVDEWQYRAHLSSLSLWDAACLNFDFGTGTPQASGHSYVNASYLTGVDEKKLTVSQFIAICRELNLGEKLQAELTETLGPGGTLQGLIEANARANLRFEAMEAYRNRASSDLTLALYETLVAAIDGSKPLAFETLSMDLDSTLLPAVPFVDTSGKRIPVPLLLIQVGSLGVVSYFPFRPSGALRYHIDAKTAGAHFLADLKASHRDGNLGWFSRQLPFTDIHQFNDLLRSEPRPPGLSVAASFLYKSFHRLFPEQTLDHVRFVADPKQGRPMSLVQALAFRHIQQYQANLGLLATRRSERDLQGVIDGAAAIASEIMALLLTPVPGGVSGLNRLMQGVVFGNLTYSLIIGINEAAKGQANDFAAAMADAADLAVNGVLISTAGRVHRQRMENLLQRLGGPRKVTHSDGTHALWKPDLRPYAIADQRLLDGQVPNAQGIYLIDGQQYVQVQQGEQRSVAQLDPAAKTPGFLLKHPNQKGVAVPIVFDPKVQAWVLDLHGAGQLSDSQLVAQMLPNGESAASPAQIRTLLRTTTTPRETLDKIWAGELPPVNLVEAVRRLQVDRVIEQLSTGFHRRGNMPAHADGAVLCLLTQLPTWPAEAVIHVHDQQGLRVESYAAKDAARHAINLKRLDNGTYLSLDGAETDVVSLESMFELIIRQQPATSTLGKEGTQHLTEAQRIARLRLQISALASAQRIALFSAMTRYAGQAQHQVPDSVAARAFLPIMAGPTGVEVTPLLAKLHTLFAPLSPANLQQLLAQIPLSAAQQSTFLSDGTLPANVREHIEQHRTALRIDAAIDGLYHPRTFNPDADLWAREFAGKLLLKHCKRDFVVTEMADGVARNRYKNSGPDDTTVELLHYGEGRYEAYDMRNGGTIPVTPAVDSFYLAIGSVLQPGERILLGMSSAADAQGLRNTLGDLMSERRSPAGLVSLLDYSLGQYQKQNVLPKDLQPNPEGLYDWDGDQLLGLYGSFYPVMFDQKVRKWRLKHPDKVGVDTPRLEHNRHGAWRLESERPQTWDDHHLFSRLGTDFNVDERTSARILSLTDTPARALREVHYAGLPPPPLLKDSTKRFGIEAQILHFIKAMSTYSATPFARPALQLQLAYSLPHWPPSHVVEIHDAEGRIIAHAPTANAGASEKIRLSEAQSRSAEPLMNLVRNDTLTKTLLGELPEGLQERLFKLAKKIAEHAHRERTQLFEAFYTQSERPGNGLHTRLRQHYPQLPGSALQALLDHATPKELKRLNEHDVVPLRLAEQARLTANDVRLNRAFEGVYLTSLQNPDSEKIMLYALAQLPGWPADVRLDIHKGSPSGPVLESAGHLAGTEQKSLVRVDGRYQAYDDQGVLIGQPSTATTDLLTAIWQVMSDEQRTALGMDDSGDITALRNAIADLALKQRVAIKTLLGIPHIPYWLQPPMRVDSSFIAYPFSMPGWWPFSRTPPVDLVSKVLELYPSFRPVDANNLLDSLGETQQQKLQKLAERKAEYDALVFGLTRWAEAEYAQDANDPWGMNLARRRVTAQQICSAWRHETRRPYDGLHFDTHSLVLRLNGNGLPDADFIIGTRGFEHIEYLAISGDSFPSTGEAFLSKFTNLKTLKLDCMLTQLPGSIADMALLERLDLSDNNITLTAESQQRLAGMTSLEELTLDGNPLGLPPDVSRMRRLRELHLRQTGIDTWPIGAETLTRMRSLQLQENQLTTVPQVLFTDAGMQATNRVTVLHDNPLNEATLQQLTEYRHRTGMLLGGAMPGALHMPPANTDFNRWLEGIPVTERAERRALWEQLEQHEGASPDDAFRVLRDLTQTLAYKISERSRMALTKRVWRVLMAMGESTDLRQRIYQNTYSAGTCGDGALLVFMNMEIECKIHKARSQPGSLQATEQLLRLARGWFYLRALDQLAEDFLRNERDMGKNPDDAEVKLYLRTQLTQEWDLPLEPAGMLYSVEDMIESADVDNIRRQLTVMKSTGAFQASLLLEEFWIDYLASNFPEPFSTISDVTRYKEEKLKSEVPDTRSDTYLERRQSLIDLQAAERLRLVNQLTVAAQRSVKWVDD